jgi:hypothetical protein
MEVLFLASLSKDNTRVKLKRVEMDSYDFWVQGQINFTFTYLLRAPMNTGLPSVAGLWLYVVPKRGDYKGRKGLSPPAAYPSTVGHEANKDSL